MASNTATLERCENLAAKLGFVGNFERDVTIIQNAVERDMITRRDVQLAGAEILGHFDGEFTDLQPYQQALVGMTTRGRYNSPQLDTSWQRHVVSMEIELDNMFTPEDKVEMRRAREQIARYQKTHPLVEY